MVDTDIRPAYVDVAEVCRDCRILSASARRS